MVVKSLHSNSYQKSLLGVNLFLENTLKPRFSVKAVSLLQIINLLISGGEKVAEDPEVRTSGKSPRLISVDLPCIKSKNEIGIYI
jgi:hypothetical protein